jgi:hypothetical protein
MNAHTLTHPAAQPSGEKRALIFWEDIEASPQAALGPWAALERDGGGEKGTQGLLKLLNYDRMFQWHLFQALEKLNKRILEGNITSYTDTNAQTLTASVVQVDEEMGRLVEQPAGSNVSYWELRRAAASRFHLTMPRSS